MTKKRRSGIPTVEQIIEDDLTQIAAKYWAPFSDNHAKFNSKVVADIYTNELLRKEFSVRQVMLLEFSQYLECFLWPNYDAETSCVEHLLSILVMANEKFRDRSPTWEIFATRPEQFRLMFRKVLETALDDRSLTTAESTIIIIFLDHCFNSLEVDLVRELIQKLVSLPIWICLDEKIRGAMLKEHRKLEKYWRLLEKRDAKMTDEQKKEADFERRFLHCLLKKFISVVVSIPEEGKCDIALVHYCERFLELLIDLESLLPVRRFFNALLNASHAVVICSLSPLCRREEGNLFAQLLSILKFYSRFEIDDISGEALAEKQMMEQHRKKISCLQNMAHKNFPEELKELYLRNISSIDSREALLEYFSKFDSDKLLSMLNLLNLLEADTSAWKHLVSDKDFLLELLIAYHERRPNQLHVINEMPLYPTEQIIWDENLVPAEFYTGNECFALNKFGLQFLTMYDYLLRNFNLFRLESTCKYEIRQDIEDAVFRLKPWKHETDESSLVTGGWARMALPITNFAIVEMGKPNLGENCPSVVRADVQLTLSMRPDVRNEWLNLRKHDVCFLLTVRPSAPINHKYDFKKPFKEQIPIAYVRGCEIEGMLGPDGQLIEEYVTKDAMPAFNTDIRTFRVWLDCNQYREDLKTQSATNGEDIYGTFNVILRRKPKENNFKAVLDTIRRLMNSTCVVPDWIHDILLGYGDPGAAHYSKMPNRQWSLDFRDTFVSLEHVKESFPECECTVQGSEAAVPPFKIDFSEEEKKRLVVSAYTLPCRGPYPSLISRMNSVRFTPAQVEAIRSGMQHGLTLIVGPPGTGKTDVAAQIISNLYHNWPDQRTLVVTHSNQALNNLFEKIMALDIDQRHLLRLGHGEEQLETEHDFSKYGRVNYVLAQRLKLLQEVERLQRSLDVAGDVAYNCETARYFFIYQISSRWAEFLKRLSDDDGRTVENVAAAFPFAGFFEDVQLFKGESFDQDMEVANSCWRYICSIFEELEEFRAFELLRGGRDRVEYLVIREAKVIAMTCTHAALRRQEFVNIGFHYDNVLMEEAAQILEIETFIPLLLQEPQDGRNRLKRWIMIGDHHQLPPVIKNQAFQKYSNMEQSLFTRFIRLGVPTVILDMQGRARPSLAALYSWRYPKLGNLRHILENAEYQLANAGFLYDYQLIDVQDFQGCGETTPTAHFYQNLAEAEYAVAIFMYMRMLGYPAERISILTTYNGQKHLIKNIVQQRCGSSSFLGSPSKVTTVDKYQGQQNDFIILSLVRTNAVGHVRDLRRLVVAMSRAKLGLYILARVSLFRNCFELTPVFNMLCHRPQKLKLVPTEVWPNGTRMVSDSVKDELIVEIEDMPHMVKFVHEYYSVNAESLKQAWIEANGIQLTTEEDNYAEEMEMQQNVVEESDEQQKTADIEFEVLNE